MKKYIPTFAVFNAKNHLYTFVASVFFYAQNIGYQIPAYYTTAKYVMVLGRTGGDSLFCIYSLTNFLTQMPRAKKIETNVKHSNVTSTPTERNTVSIEQFTTELNAKNKAYAFILLTGQLHHFERFCQTIKVLDNPHDLCIALLKEEIKT